MGMETIIKFYCDGRVCGEEVETDMDVDEYSSVHMGVAVRAYEEHGPYEHSWENDFQNAWHFFYNRGSGPYGRNDFTGMVLCDQCAKEWYAEKTGKKECYVCEGWRDKSEFDDEDDPEACPKCREED